MDCGSGATRYDGKESKMRGRRPAAVRMRRFTLALYLHPVVDADLIAALESASRRRRAALVREWLRSGRTTLIFCEDTELPDLEDLGVAL